MINRLLIRIKTVQLVYACLQSEEPRIYADEKLRESLEATQKLYNYLLALIVKVTDYRRQQIEAAKGKFLPTREDLNPNTRFIDNKLARMIAEKSEAVEYCEREGLTSDFDTELYRSILEAIEQGETFGQYMKQREVPTFEQDKELWLEILTTIFPQCEKLDEVLEERDIYWNDDLTTVLKALTRMIQRLKPEREMIPAGKLFQNEEDERFALDLFHYSLDEYFDNVKLIDAITPNWEAERIAMMDKVIISCALSEIRHFPDIAIAVSVNEYIELAKHYCSAKSASFANGVIDKIATSWRADHVIFKK
ncbi:MAG: hypothetical protein J6Y05_01665 [Bacteroidales bacterium]|nr:hypothetical protein [Bacteroidales bacterium]